MLEGRHISARDAFGGEKSTEGGNGDGLAAFWAERGALQL
jgi:hypothetical protein